MSKTILDLTDIEARRFLLKSEQYCTFRLPEYFSFDNVISFAEQTIGKKNEYQCFAIDFEKSNDTKLKRVSPSNFDEINYLLFSNKDGKLDYRPFSLINPFYYYLLVRIITEPDAWKEIVNRFNELKDSHISVGSLPIVDESNRDKKTILEWWTHVEQQSLELSLQYKYMFVTDITNCYGSIYTHSLAWAMMGKDEARKNKGNNALLGNRLDIAVQCMQYGQTNGIPQGNVVSDLLAELVLAYADSLIVEKTKEKGYTDYKIIRYRDDYRIFSNDRNVLEDMSLILQKVLSSLNFKINSSKTSIEDDLIVGSVKEDKIAFFNMFLYRTSLDVESLKNDKSLLQKELLAIYTFGKQYPNSGSVERMLGDVYDWFKESGIDKCRWMVLCAILTAIAKDNPRTYGIVAAIISLIIDRASHEERMEIINDVYKKISKWPNSGLLLVWLQRITLKVDQQINYDDKLCKMVSGDSIEIWNNDWLDPSLLVGFSSDLVVSRDIIEKMNLTIDKKEVSPFYKYMSESEMV